MKLRIAILGPTCSGKSAIALKLAEQINADIISCDSMQVYKGMDIGTAKTSLSDRQKIRHHLIDILDVSQSFNVSKFIELSNQVLLSAETSEKPIILVGGTGLYAKALIYQYELKSVDSSLNQKLQQQANTRNGYTELYNELEQKRPLLAKNVGKNPRRLVRAVEILRMSDKKAENIKSNKNQMTSPKWFQVILIPNRDMHRQAIQTRIKLMIDTGWIEETRKLLGIGFLNSPTARQALGYMEIAGYLLGNENCDSSEIANIIQQKTSQYAKRQITWFKHQHPGAVYLAGMTQEESGNWISRQL